MSISKRYLEIAKVNLRHNFIPHLLLALLFIALTPLIFGVSNLDALAAWAPLEMFFALVGIILLTPVFTPEQAEDNENVIAARYTNINGIYLLRIIYSVAALVLLVVGFGLFMKVNGSEVTLIHIIGTAAEAIFLGSLGILGTGLCKNVAAGYMLPILYYAINYAGGAYLGNLYIFSGSNGSHKEKIWLLSGGIIVIAFTFIFRIVKQRRA